MKKEFISPPMNGKTNEEIESVREKAIASTLNDVAFLTGHPTYQKLLRYFW